MNLIRYKPSTCSTWPSFNRLPSLHEELNRLFDTAFPVSHGTGFQGWTPALDVYDEKDSVVVKTDLPGLNQEDIRIQVHEGVLTISGERKNERESKESQTFRTERTFGRFLRSLSLPVAIDTARIAATYKDGILTIDLPKAEDAKPRQIEVKVS
jgi:HSP20 family protein